MRSSMELRAQAFLNYNSNTAKPKRTVRAVFILRISCQLTGIRLVHLNGALRAYQEVVITLLDN